MAIRLQYFHSSKQESMSGAYTVTVALNAIQGFITLMASTRFLYAKQFFIYHSQASGLTWEQVSPKLQLVILAILRVGGVGFLTVAVFILAASISLYLQDSALIRILIAVLTCFFWAGIFGITYGVYTRTKAKTPWRLSLILAMVSWVPLIIYFVSAR